MISPELRADLLKEIQKTVGEFDTPEHTIDPRKTRGVGEGHHMIFVAPYRAIFSRSQDSEKKENVTRILSISWHDGKPFGKDDIAEWQSLAEDAIGKELVYCRFAFTDQRRIYCMW